jgi:cytochrome c-type biogenesis protein CcmH
MPTRPSSHVSLVLLLLILSAGISAQDVSPSVETRAQGIFRSVMSPYCPGQLLATCPSSAADELRDQIRADLRAGRSASDIESALYRRFGDGVRATPAARGTGLLVWIVPALLFLAGGVIYGIWLRRTSPPTDAESPLAPLAPALADRLEDELSRD